MLNGGDKMGDELGDTTTIKVCVIAPFEPLRMGLVAAIGNADGIRVIAEANSLSEVPGRTLFRDADVIVIDSDAMLGPGRMTYAQLDELLPSLKVLFLGSRDDARNVTPDDLPAYMRLNTVGFVLKDGPISRLADAIRLLAAGTFVCETELIRHILTRLSQWATYSDEARNGEQLSIREGEVLTLVTRGSSNKQIAQRLVITPKTASNHIEHIYTKIQATGRASAALFAMQHGLVPEEQAV